MYNKYTTTSKLKSKKGEDMGLIVDDSKKKVRKAVVKKAAASTGSKSPVTSEMIAKKAYELYEQRGCQPGRELEDWNEAKRLLEA